MKYGAYLWGTMLLCLIVIVFLLVRITNLGSEVQAIRDQNNRDLAALQDSLKRVQAELGSAKEAMPGLGEYMTTIQLHAGKLWFAAKALNWELADYELDELKETMKAAKALNAEKNGVKISGVLDSVLQTQVAQLADIYKEQESKRNFRSRTMRRLPHATVATRRQGTSLSKSSGPALRPSPTRSGNFKYLEETMVQISSQSRQSALRITFVAFTVAVSFLCQSAVPASAQTIVDEWATVQAPKAPELKPVTLDPKTTASTGSRFCKADL